MSAEVKAALEAAGVAVWQRMDMLGYETPDVGEAEAIAGAAIAAFLRALPKDATVWIPSPGKHDRGRPYPWMKATALAAAVTAAAQEGGQ